MNGLIELKAILARNQVRKQTVTVISSSPTVVKGTGRQGMVTLKNDGSIYHAGDEIVIQDSIILGLVARSKDITDYYV